jgi:hypothetical protein
MPDELGTKQIWKSISSAIGVEMREATSIRGNSGQDHPVQGVAVDDKTNRVVIFSAEPSPRIAALMQTDVQVTLPGVHVLVARPVIFDLSEIVRRVVEKRGDLNIEAIAALFKQQSTSRRSRRVQKNTNEIIQTKIIPVIKPLFETASKIRLPFSVQVMDVVEQLTSLDWKSSTLSMEGFLITLFSMTTLDSTSADRRLGICPIPLYEFSEADCELLLSGKNVEEVQARLKALGIYQYFFPAPDQLLLGLADNNVTKDGSLVLAAEEAPTHGHPLGAAELLQDKANLLETLEELKGAGYVADAEIGLEITEKGRTVRQNVKIRPREGLIVKYPKSSVLKSIFLRKTSSNRPPVATKPPPRQPPKKKGRRIAAEAPGIGVKGQPLSPVAPGPNKSLSSDLPFLIGARSTERANPGG